MALTRLQDDLLQEFREEKRTVGETVALLDPLGVSLRRPAAQRLASKGLVVFFELLCWLAVPSAAALAHFLHRLSPSSLLFQLKQPPFREQLGEDRVRTLLTLIYAAIALLGILFLLLALALGRIRQKNDVLWLAGRNIKASVGQLLQRKAAIDAIEQRHFTELPAEPAAVKLKVNEVPNPGYDG
jgi:hypothetical protein